MKLLDLNGRRGDNRVLSVGEPKTGMGFRAITFYAEDFERLARLSPERLHEWLTYWQCGFMPGAAGDA